MNNATYVMNSIVPLKAKFVFGAQLDNSVPPSKNRVRKTSGSGVVGIVQRHGLMTVTHYRPYHATMKNQRSMLVLCDHGKTAPIGKKGRAMINLRYCVYTAHNYGVEIHPQKQMAELGISYQKATPQSIADQWWFWDCSNVPDKWAPYLMPLEIKPLDAVGWGLSQQDAEKLTND